MRDLNLGLALVAAGLIAAGFSTGTAWAGGPDGATDPANDLFEAVGSGTFDDSRDGPGGASTEVGFRATGPTADQASAAVVTACEAAGGVDCTSDEVTNDNVCIVSVFDPGTGVDAGGAGATVEAARQDAIQRAAAANTPMSSAAAVLISACP